VGLAGFSVQVSRALGRADQATFCADDAIITSALSAATTRAALRSALQASVGVILDLQSAAPVPANPPAP
jgi:hypothetical protein